MDFAISQIKGLIFDYGATIDSDGKHWGEVIWEAYLLFAPAIKRDDYNDAYVYAERYMAKHRVIEPQDNYAVLMNKKIHLQAQELLRLGYMLTEQQLSQIASYCYDYAKRSVEVARPILLQLQQKYPLVLVSNFYGNIQAVLSDFQLDTLFSSVVESAVVGVRKPDPQIFQLGVDALSLPASQVVVIGDSFSKDINPSLSIGCHAIWLKGLAWKGEDDLRDYENTIESFVQLKQLFL